MSRSARSLRLIPPQRNKSPTDDPLRRNKRKTQAVPGRLAAALYCIAQSLSTCRPACRDPARPLGVRTRLPGQERSGESKRMAQAAHEGQARQAGRHRSGSRRTAAGLPHDAADPPLRGKRRPALRHGADRRLLPSVYRPGSRRRRHAAGDRRRRRGHHLLSRPRPHAGDRHGPQGRDGRADRAARRLLARQGRLDAHVQQGEELLRRARHRRRAGQPRHRPGVQQLVSRQRPRLADLFRRGRVEPGPGV